MSRKDKGRPQLAAAEKKSSAGASPPWVKALPGWLPPASALACLLIVLVIAAYLPALSAGFIWDDDKYVTANPMLTDPDGLREIWLTAHTQSQYFPLVYTTLRLEHTFWGLAPLGYHLVNILLHGLNAVLVWIVLKRLQLPGAWFAAAIFALHPVNVESVAWVTELKNVESLLFYLLALLAWLKFLEPRASSPQLPAWRAPWLYYSLAVAAALLALFAKTTACTLPAALILVLWLRRQSFSWPRAAQILPFLFLGVIMGVVSIWWEGNLGTYNDDAGPALTMPQRLILAGRALWFYLGKLLWPANLTFSYPHWDLSPDSPLQYLPLLGWLAVAVAFWLARDKIGRGTPAALIFYAATLAPLLGFITDYTFRYAYVADHYQYVAALGPFALFAAAWEKFAPKSSLPPSATTWFKAGLLLTLGWLTWQQCGAYRNPETLWRDTIAKNPGSWMAHYNLGMEFQDQGRLDEAIEQFQATLALNPKHLKAENNLGLDLAASGRYVEAISHYRAALNLNPAFVGTYDNLAVALASEGEYDQAVSQLQQAVKLDPNTIGIWINLGSFLKQAGRTDEAAAAYQKAASRFPSEVEPLRRLAELSADAGHTGDAVKHYQQALQLAPDRADLLLALGNTFVAETNYDAAIKSYRHALQSEPDNAGIHYNLGVLLATEGHIELARQELSETLRLRPDFSPAARRLQLLPPAPAK